MMLELLLGAYIYSRNYDNKTRLDGSLLKCEKFDYVQLHPE